MSSRKVPVSISLPHEQVEALNKRLKNRYGDRSLLISKLIELFLLGKIVVTIPGKRF